MQDRENPHSVPSKKLSSLFQYLQERGVDPNALVMNLESRPEAWRDSESSIPLDLWLALCRSAALTLGDPDFGLGFGTNFWGMPTLLGHMMAACRDLREALDAYVLYQEIERHSWRMSIREEPEEAHILFQPLASLSRDRLILDFVLTSTLGMARRLTGQDLVLRGARFAYPAPGYARMHGSLFSCPLAFGAPETCLVLAKAELDLPVRTANREVRDLLEASLKKALRQQGGERRYSMLVMEAVARRRGGTTIDVPSVAREIGVGVRDLQSKLKQEGTSFRQLKDACQSEMAMDYLRDTSLGLKEIAYILGFSDQRAFHRAFLRWTGKTPGEAKRELGEKCRAADR